LPECTAIALRAVLREGGSLVPEHVGFRAVSNRGEAERASPLRPRDRRPAISVPADAEDILAGVWNDVQTVQRELLIRFPEATPSFGSNPEACDWEGPRRTVFAGENLRERRDASALPI